MEPAYLLCVSSRHKLQQCHRFGGHLSPQQQQRFEQVGKNSGMGEGVRSVSKTPQKKLEL